MMPLWSDDPTVIVLSILAAWGFLAACVLRDRLSNGRGRVGISQPDPTGRAVAPVHRPSALFDWAEENTR
jgi:hypothetical protein